MRVFKYFISYQSERGATGNIELELEEPIKSIAEIGEAQDTKEKWRIEKHGPAIAKGDKIIILYWRRF